MNKRLATIPPTGPAGSRPGKYKRTVVPAAAAMFSADPVQYISG